MTDPVDFALWQRIHGHLAVLGLAVLLHPVITLGRRRILTRGAWWSVIAAAGLLTTSFTLGWWLYPTYRARVKPALYAEHPEVMLRFETKEHLAWLTISLVVAGTLALWRGGEEARDPARHLFAAAWLTGVITAGLGVYVAASASPGW
jgi:hypothetical protein